MKLKLFIKFRLLFVILIISNTLQAQFNFVQPTILTGTATLFTAGSTPSDLVGDPAITPNIDPTATTVASYSSSGGFDDTYIWIGIPNTITMTFSSPVSLTGVAIWNAFASGAYLNPGFLEPDHSVNLASFEFFSGGTSLGSQNINVLFPDDAFGELYPFGTTYLNVTTIVMTVISNHGGNETAMQEIAFNSVPINLSVELSEFNLACGTQEVEIKWSTAAEHNNDFFTVERSSDGTIFEKLVTINGKGTSTLQNEYSWIDNRPFSGRSYYRLSQTDYDGVSKTYITSMSDCNNDKVQIYPNPFENRLTISIDDKATFSLLDVTGKIVLEAAFEAGTNTFTVENLPFGSYIGHIRLANGNTEQIKLIKFK